MSISIPKMLVYIPTYVDHHLAADQARVLREDFKSAKVSLQIIISVNGVQLTPQEIANLEDVSDRLIIFDESLGGDTNINLGFLIALQESADFFWILSANDTLLASCGSELKSAIENLQFDFLIIGKPSNGLSGFLLNAFSGEGLQLPIGLISAVIYRTEVFKEAFANSIKYAWTGWGQLSVLQNTLFERSVLKYELIDEKKVYDRIPTTSIDSQIEKNKSNYRHSFFGYPLIISLLFNEDKKSRDELIRKWLLTNWYKIGYFKTGRSPSQILGHTAKDAFWTGPLSRQYILRSGPFSPLLYFFGHIPFLGISRRFVFLKRLHSTLSHKDTSRDK
jgi:hypothetical protein